MGQRAGPDAWPSCRRVAVAVAAPPIGRGLGEGNEAGPRRSRRRTSSCSTARTAHRRGSGRGCDGRGRDVAVMVMELRWWSGRGPSVAVAAHVDVAVAEEMDEMDDGVEVE